MLDEGYMILGLRFYSRWVRGLRAHVKSQKEMVIRKSAISSDALEEILGKRW